MKLTIEIDFPGITKLPKAYDTRLTKFSFQLEKGGSVLAYGFRGGSEQGTITRIAIEE